ncbi:hypothetical protein ACSBR1_041773 [Camellia fascicularis]
MDESRNPQLVCPQEALDLLNCTIESSFDQDKCLRLLQTLRDCAQAKNPLDHRYRNSLFLIPSYHRHRDSLSLILLHHFSPLLLATDLAETLFASLLPTFGKVVFGWIRLFFAGFVFGYHRLPSNSHS